MREQKSYFVVQLTRKTRISIIKRWLLASNLSRAESVFFEEKRFVQNERGVSRLRGVEGCEYKLGG